MQRVGSAVLPLHYGHPPERLFRRMMRLSGILSDLIVEKFGSEELLKKLSDPFWFHSFSLAIGFDWNSSGTTTSTLAALKEYLGREEGPVRIMGGKGKRMGDVGRESKRLIDNGFMSEARMSGILEKARKVAKVDQKLLQDGYDLYLHFIISDEKGSWTVVQQGMSDRTRLARRYHWFHRNVQEALNDGRTGISAQQREMNVLDLTTRLSEKNRNSMLEILKDNPNRYRYTHRESSQKTLFPDEGKHLDLDIRVDWKKLSDLYESSIVGFEELYLRRGVGESTIRALSYLAELIFGDEPSFQDPLKFSFALGGKDGIPKPVDYADYDRCLDFYSEVLSDYKLGSADSIRMVQNLSRAGFRINHRTI